MIGLQAEFKNGLKRPLKYYYNWRYKNTGLLAISLVLLYFFAGSQFVRSFIESIGSLGYLGAFLTGIFFTSVFTVAPAVVVLYYLADLLDPFEVALLAGAGAVIGDYVIFRFLKDQVFEELEPLVKQLGGSYLGKLFKTPYFAWTMPFLGAVVIASPLPDELGISMLSLSKIGNWPFVVLSFFLNAIGIFIVVTLARAI